MGRFRWQGGDGWILPFAAGLVAGAAGLVVARAAAGRKLVDPRLIRRSREGDVPPVVVVPGVMGSSLHRPDGTPVWLNLGNAFGSYSLALPLKLPFTESADDLVPGELIGTRAMLPRLFGFTEYADLMELLESAGFREVGTSALVHRVFTYDWRRDLVESARRLHEALEDLAEERGDPHARFTVVGHSMGGLVARYYLRYGTAEPTPDATVSWAGARRIETLALVATPSAGSLHALEALLGGSRVGLSYTTLAAPVVARMPSLYQLLPHSGTHPLLDHRGEPLALDVTDPTTWERLGWGPHARARKEEGSHDDEVAFLEAALARARAFHAALARRPETPCPARVAILGGDTIPTLGHAALPHRKNTLPSFEPDTSDLAEHMYEAGDGRVTRASVLALHHPDAEDTEPGFGVPEASTTVFGSADHHGIYTEPTFQSILLRLILRRPGRRRTLLA